MTWFNFKLFNNYYLCYDTTSSSNIWYVVIEGRFRNVPFCLKKVLEEIGI